MSDIIFSKTSFKIPKYETILMKISNKFKSFGYDNNLLKSKFELLEKLNLLKSVQDKYINLEISVEKSFFNEFLNEKKEILKISDKIKKTGLEGYKELNNYLDELEILFKAQSINNFLIFQINRFFDGNVVSPDFEITKYDNNLTILLDYISNTKEAASILHVMYSVNTRFFNIEKILFDRKYISIDNLINELKGVKKILNSEKINLDSDFNIQLNVSIKTLADFLIGKINESFDVNTYEIEKSFDDLLKKSEKNISDSTYGLLVFILGIIVLNMFIFYINFDKEFNYSSFFHNLPLIVIEIILFKFMFFFFNRYDSYSKVSSMYDYYKGLIKADKIYTSDKQFDKELNFKIREKTYTELTNFSSHLKGLVDKKQTYSKDLLEIIKEMKDTSVILNKS